MIGLPSKHLLFHGSIILLVGILSGVQFWQAIIKDKGKEKVRAWRVTHSFLTIYGMMMLIVGLILQYLTLSELIVWVSAWALVIAGYAFAVAFTLGAWKGYRGLTPKPYGLNTILFMGHVIGAFGSLIGIVIVIYGSYEAL